MNENNSEKPFDWYLIFKELFQKKLDDRSFVDHKLQQLEKDGWTLTEGIVLAPIGEAGWALAK